MQNVPFTVRDKDIKSFTNAFFASGQTNQRVLDGQRPSRVIYRYPPSTNVDILPLLEVKIASPETEVTVIPGPADTEEQFYSQYNCELITEILENTSPALRHDIQASKISELCFHHDGRFYLWYKPGHTPHGVDMTLDREGQAFTDQMRRLCNMPSFEDWSGAYLDVAFEGIDVRNFNNSSRAEDVEKE